MWREGTKNMQFSLGRMFRLVFVVAVISTLFAQLKWPLALLALPGLNGAASLGFWGVKKSRLARMALVTSLLMLVTLILTDWGLSSLHPVARIAWPVLVAACIAQLLTLLLWLVSVPTETYQHRER